MSQLSFTIRKNSVFEEIPKLKTSAGLGHVSHWHPLLAVCNYNSYWYMGLAFGSEILVLTRPHFFIFIFISFIFNKVRRCLSASGKEFGAKLRLSLYLTPDEVSSSLLLYSGGIWGDVGGYFFFSRGGSSRGERDLYLDIYPDSRTRCCYISDKSGVGLRVVVQILFCIGVSLPLRLLPVLAWGECISRLVKIKVISA